MDDSIGKSNLDLPSKLLNSTTVKSPKIFLPFLLSNVETQLTVPPVARRSSTMAKELNFLRAFFCIEREFSPYSKL